MNGWKKLLVICVAGAALFSAAAEAKEVKLRRGERGLYNVVDHACSSPLWLSEAMRLTPLDSSGLTKLKVGDRVVVPDNCKHRRPPAEVKDATLRLFKHEELEPAHPHQENSGGVEQSMIAEREIAKREVVNLKDEKRQLDEKLKIAEADRITANREVVTLREEKRQLGLKLDIANAKADDGSKNVDTNSQWWFAVSGIVVGTVLTFGAVWFLVVRKLRADGAALELTLLRVRAENETLELEMQLAREENQFLTAQAALLNECLRVAREEEEKRLRVRLSAFASGQERAARSIVFLGKEVKFQDTSDYTVACPYCPRATKIRANAYQMEGHLLKSHPELLHEEISPEEMERKMAQCS